MRIPERICSALREHAQETALQNNAEQITNEELMRGAASLIPHLLRLPDRAPVVLYGHKQAYMKQGLLACLLAGVPYVPLDTTTPVCRVQAILRQIRPALVVGHMPDAPCACILPKPDGDLHLLRVYERAPNDLCYILFTSGSTGVPKGVCVSYANLETCISWLCTLPAQTPKCILNQANYAFDLSVADIYLSLIYGARHVLPCREEIRDFARLFSTLRESGADTAVWTPSFAQLLLRERSFEQSMMPNLRTILFCGEALPPAAADSLLKRFPGIQIWNCYGPTECTFAVTARQITEADTMQPVLSVGRPKPGVRLLTMNEDGQALPTGDAGEICICGDSVALGYRQPDSNNAFRQTPRGRMYRTGDRGFVRDGNWFITGRIDRQIKLSGYRIEPGEIENVLLSLPHVRAAVVLPQSGAGGETIALRAFVAADSSRVSVPQLRTYLCARLPVYMIPHIRLVPEIPLTENGKADIQKLMHQGGAK